MKYLVFIVSFSYTNFGLAKDMTFDGFSEIYSHGNSQQIRAEAGKVCPPGKYVYSEECGFGYTRDRYSAPLWPNISDNDSARLDPNSNASILEIESACYVYYPDQNVSNGGSNCSYRWETAIHYNSYSCEANNECYLTSHKPTIQFSESACVSNVTCEEYQDKHRYHERWLCPPYEFQSIPYRGDTLTMLTREYDMQMGFHTDDSQVNTKLFLREPNIGLTEDEILSKSQYNIQELNLRDLKEVLEREPQPVSKKMLSEKDYHKLMLRADSSTYNNFIAVGAECDPQNSSIMFIPYDVENPGLGYGGGLGGIGDGTGGFPGFGGIGNGTAPPPNSGGSN